MSVPSLRVAVKLLKQIFDRALIDGLITRNPVADLGRGILPPKDTAECVDPFITR